MPSYESHAPSSKIDPAASNRFSESKAGLIADALRFLPGPSGKIATISKDAAHPIEFKKSDAIVPIITPARRQDIGVVGTPDPTALVPAAKPLVPSDDKHWNDARRHEGRQPVAAPPAHGIDSSRPELKALVMLTVAALSMEAISGHRSIPHLPHEEYERDLVALTIKTNKELSPDRRLHPKFSISMKGRDSTLVPLNKNQI